MVRKFQRRFRGRIINNAPDKLPLSPLERAQYAKTHRDTFFALTVPELQMIAQTAVGAPIKHEHEDAVVGHVTRMIVNASEGSADVEFELADNDAGLLASELMRRDYSQLSLSHGIEGDRLTFREVSLCKKGGRQGTCFSAIVSATSKTGNVDTSTPRLSTAVSDIQAVNMQGVAESQSNAAAPVSADQVPANTSAAAAQPPAAAAAAPAAAAQSQSQSQTPAQSPAASADTSADAEMTDSSPDALENLGRLMESLKDALPSKDRGRVTRALNQLAQQTEAQQRELALAQRTQMQHFVQQKCQGVFETLRMDAKAQETFVNGIVDAKSSNKVFEQFEPVMARCVDTIRKLQAQAQQTPTLHQVSDPVMVNASAGEKRRRVGDASGDEDKLMEAFHTACARSQKLHAPAYRPFFVPPPEQQTTNQLTTVVSASANVSDEPRQPPAARDGYSVWRDTVMKGLQKNMQ